jgi:hypothetical protein
MVRSPHRRRAPRPEQLGGAPVGRERETRSGGLVHGAAQDRVAERVPAGDDRGPDQIQAAQLVECVECRGLVEAGRAGRELELEWLSGDRCTLEEGPRIRRGGTDLLCDHRPDPTWKRAELMFLEPSPTRDIHTAPIDTRQLDEVEGVSAALAVQRRA